MTGTAALRQFVLVKMALVGGIGQAEGYNDKTTQKEQ
jgi:hypothetical protein